MVALQYKGRIHKGKVSVRSLRYIAADRISRAFPSLQRRWLWPVEGEPIADAATGVHVMRSITVAGELHPVLQRLGLIQPAPFIEQHVYGLENIIMTGWAGAMMKDGLLLTTRPRHNWVSALRPHPHRLRTLPSGIVHINLMAPMTARGHIFHWLYDSIVPLLSYLEERPDRERIGLIVNAKRTAIQDLTLDYVRSRFPIETVETVEQHEAVSVPELRAIIAVPHTFRGLQAPGGLAHLDGLGEFIGQRAAATGGERIYISRSDAKLRRVLNEGALIPELSRHGFERVALAQRPIPEQVALFRGARVVVAPHGAGLAHLTWCRPGTKLVEIFPSPDGARGRVRNASSDYWLICSSRNIEYDAVFGGGIEDRADGFTISGENLQHILKKAVNFA